MDSPTSIDPPIPAEAIAELEVMLGRSLAGWEAKRPRWVSPSPAEIPGAWFDTAEVARVVRVLRQMPHTKTRQWARKPFEPETWQLVWIIAPVFGWKNEQNRRIVRMVWDEVPRKNGKSTLSSRLALFLASADGEEGPEVYAAATSTDQARQVFNEAGIVAQRSDALQQIATVLTSVIRFPQTFGVFRVLSRVAESIHGLNVSGAVIDEIHLHKKRDLIDAIETGTGAREQPLIIHITTAGDDDETTIYAEKHNLAVKIAEGEVVNPSMWVCIWAADPKADPFDLATVAEANPNYPIAPTPEYIAEKIDMARSTPTFRPTFLRLHLNIRNGLMGEVWPGSEAWNWEGNGGIVPLDKLKGRKCWGGLVAASATDLAALCWTFENPEGKGAWSIWRYFLPEEQLGELNRRTSGNAQAWAPQWLTVTEGNELDIPGIVEQIRADAKLFDVRELAFDPGGAIGIVQPLLADRVAEMIAIYPSTPGTALVDWEQMLRSGQYNHGGNPITAWQIAHLGVRETGAGVWRIDRKGSPENVYGATAAELALRRFLVGGGKRSKVLHVSA